LEGKINFKGERVLIFFFLNKIFSGNKNILGHKKFGDYEPGATYINELAWK